MSKLHFTLVLYYFVNYTLFHYSFPSVFLSRQPNVGTVDDTPLTTVKAVLSEIIKALGGETVMQLLTSLRLSVTTMIFK